MREDITESGIVLNSKSQKNLPDKIVSDLVVPKHYLPPTTIT
jgi:hypothetical protein